MAELSYVQNTEIYTGKCLRSFSVMSKVNAFTRNTAGWPNIHHGTFVTWSHKMIDKLDFGDNEIYVSLERAEKDLSSDIEQRTMKSFICR